jgi:transposase-like protein
VGLQALENKVLSWSIIGKSAPILAEITIRKSQDIVKHGLSPESKQRYRCRQCLEGRGRTFLLAYSYAGQSPAVKQQIVDMAMNASGIRDTARVLHISPTTVLKELKKRHLTCNR